MNAPNPTHVPKTVTLTIDGRPVQAALGQTVLQAAEAAGIPIPALCHHPALAPAGSCRLCVVEIEKQRMPQPACTFPAADGLVVRTQSPALASLRKLSLQMLFSERAHYCMTCPAGGTCHTTDCELQKLAYDCGMTHWAFPPDTARRWPVDASHPELVLDHARCVLCRRCVRACAEMAANHTLGVHYRGSKAVIGADDNIPLGLSSCVSCGACAQVCPTGAITERRAAFAGHDADMKHVSSVCVGCAAACGIDVAVRDNRVVRIDGNYGGPNAGLVCRIGRYDALRAPAGGGRRITRPLVRFDGHLSETAWDGALDYLAGKLNGAAVAGLASPRLLSESLASFGCFFHEVLSSGQVALSYGEAPPCDLGRQGSLDDVADADCIVVIGQDPLVEHPVIGYLIKRAYDRGASVVVIDDAPTNLDRFAREVVRLEEIAAHGESPFERLRHTFHLRVGGLKKLHAAVQPAARPVIVYAAGLTSTVYAALRTMPEKVCFLPLVKGTNTRGAERLGLVPQPVEGDVLFALVGDDVPPIGPPDGFAFRAVHAAYPSAWTDTADVVLPARLWTERAGHIIDLEGRRRVVSPLVAPPAGMPDVQQILLELAKRLGRDLPFDELRGVFTHPADTDAPTMF